MRFEELRIHGVSGTPPRDILYTDPVTSTPADDPTKLYGRREIDECFETRAFHWANLTSGNRRTALWLLLAPFALANTAGWMVGWRRRPTDPLPDPTGPEKWHAKLGRMAIRLASTSLTALFVSQVVTAGVLLPYEWTQTYGVIELLGVRLEINALDKRTILTILTLAVGLLFYWLVANVSAKSLFEDVSRLSHHGLLLNPNPNTMLDATGERATEATRAAGRQDPGGARITDAVLWTVHPMLHRLRRIHFTAGLMFISLTIGAARGVIDLEAALAIMFFYVLATGWLTTYFEDARWGWWLTSILPLLALALFGLAVGSIWLPEFSWNPDVMHQMTFGAAMILGVGTLLSLVAGPLSSGALVLATFIGATMGSAAGLFVDTTLNTRILVDKGVGWVAVAAMFFVLALVVVALVLGFRGTTDERWGATSPLVREYRWLMIGRRIELQAGVIFYAAAAFGLGAFGYAATIVRDGGFDPAALPPFPDWLVWPSISFVMIPIGVFAFRSIRKGWAGGEEGVGRRRQVGILWDLGSFWPRWYHPLAPPGYGPKAVTDMESAISGLPEGAVLGAHSQGSMIAAVAITRSDRRVSLITYGSQLGLLYPRMFPMVGIPNLTDRVADVCAGDWVNLWRRSDPIGGHYVEHPLVTNVEVEEGSGHSGHEITGTYRETRRDLVGLGEEGCEESGSGETPQTPTIQPGRPS